MVARSADATPDGDGDARRALEGTLERITFHADNTGYTVARLATRGGDGVVTIVGALAGARVGAALKVWGHWATHARYGRQFAVEDFVEQVPATIEGIRGYLGSGLIRGVGPVTADRIVGHFGLATLDVISASPERLHEVPGVGEVRVRQIIHAWREQQQIKEIMLFLQSHDVPTGLAVRIYKHYRTRAIAVVRDDPYRLAREVFGIGFATADRIALRMGIAPDSPQRLDAGVLFTLEELAGDGHVFGARDTLVDETARRLAQDGQVACVPAEQVAAAVARLESAADVRIEAATTTQAPGVAETPSQYAVASPSRREPARAHDAVYLPALFDAEIGVAGRIRRLLADRASRLGVFRKIDWDAALQQLDRRSPYPLAPAQRDAVRAALTHKVSVITGGPGTGKTTTVRAVLQLLGTKGLTAELCAPTGRAARRLAEATGREARTIHRLLEFRPTAGSRFQRNEDHPLDTALVVVDEVSMVDLLLMDDLLRAVPPSSHLLLVGDVDQLPSVGAGNVLRDLIESGAVPTVVLQQIFRQDAGSYIVTNAHRINQGLMPLVERDSRDFFVAAASDPARAADSVVKVVSERIPQVYGLDPLRDVQVLSPMHRGQAGVTELNARLQAVLNPPATHKVETAAGHRVLRDGDKVMQLRNNYDKGVFNGDLGRIAAINRIDQTVTIAYDDGPVDYEFAEMHEVAHAFACSVHKSQGAEYPAVVMTLLPAHYMLLQRNLLYTAVTRARKLCVIVGSERAIGMAVRNDRQARRNSALARRLASPGDASLR